MCAPASRVPASWGPFTLPFPEGADGCSPIKSPLVPPPVAPIPKVEASSIRKVLPKDLSSIRISSAGR